MIYTPHPSPNFNQRHAGDDPDMVVLHYTAMQSAEEALQRLSDPNIKVSAHYLISEAGELFRLVDEGMRAWHAGAGRWGAVADVNSHSIGIELANQGDCPFPEPQMQALEVLLADIMARYAIPPQRIIGHSDMAPDRKRDPGGRFDWRRLAILGLSVWPNPIKGQNPKTSLTAQLRRFGMSADCDEQTLLTAFRLRFRPWADGPVDDLDLAMAHDLATRFPVDAPPLSA